MSNILYQLCIPGEQPPNGIKDNGNMSPLGDGDNSITLVDDPTGWCEKVYALEALRPEQYRADVAICNNMGTGTKDNYLKVCGERKIGGRIYLGENFQGPGVQTNGTSANYIWQQMHQSDARQNPKPGTSHIAGPPGQLMFVQNGIDTLPERFNTDNHAPFVYVECLIKRDHRANGGHGPAQEVIRAPIFGPNAPFGFDVMDLVGDPNGLRFVVDAKWHHRDGHFRVLLQEQLVFNSDDYGDGGWGYEGQKRGPKCVPFDIYGSRGSSGKEREDTRGELVKSWNIYGSCLRLGSPESTWEEVSCHQDIPSPPVIPENPVQLPEPFLPKSPSQVISEQAADPSIWPNRELSRLTNSLTWRIPVDDTEDDIALNDEGE